MAAPAAMQKRKYAFRDAKGQVGRMVVLIGGADSNGVETNYIALANLLQAVSNAHVSLDINPAADRAYGAQAVYETVEDKAQLTFTAALADGGTIHRWQVPAPKAAIFQADGQTVDQAQADVVALVGAFETYVYPASSATAPMAAYIGGFRVKRKLQRRMNVFTKSANLDEPAE